MLLTNKQAFHVSHCEEASVFGPTHPMNLYGPSAPQSTNDQMQSLMGCQERMSARRDTGAMVQQQQQQQQQQQEEGKDNNGAKPLVGVPCGIRQLHEITLSINDTQTTTIQQGWKTFRFPHLEISSSCILSSGYSAMPPAVRRPWS